jgi:GMP synthase-like glutamine amidotransferase
MKHPLRIHVFQHEVFEGLGAILPWAESRGHAVTYTQWFLGEGAPESETYDWLIVMGGSMGVHDDGQFVWLSEEKQALLAAVKKGKPILGICLGAQLLAHVLGAWVGQNRDKEIGWHPVQALGPAQGAAHEAAHEVAQRAVNELGHQGAKGNWLWDVFPESLTTFHWHGDTFELPPGSLHLAKSEGCQQQAFIFGEKAVGLQFHPEVTSETVEALMAGCANDLTPGPYVQTLAQLKGKPEYFASNRIFLETLLAGLAARV